MTSFGAEAAPTPKSVFFWSLSLSLTFAPHLLNNLKKWKPLNNFLQTSLKCSSQVPPFILCPLNYVLTPLNDFH